MSDSLNECNPTNILVFDSISLVSIFQSLLNLLKPPLVEFEVMGIPHSSFEEKIARMKQLRGVELDTELTESDLKELVEQYKNVYLTVKGEEFPSGILSILIMELKEAHA